MSLFATMSIKELEEFIEENMRDRKVLKDRAQEAAGYLNQRRYEELVQIWLDEGATPEVAAKKAEDGHPPENKDIPSQRIG